MSQGDFSYVQNETDTPADIIFTGNTMPSIVDSQNDYWTAAALHGLQRSTRRQIFTPSTLITGRIITKEPGVVGMPYGMGATQHTVGATISREIMKNVRLKLQYGYYHYRDETSGGHNNYDAHAVFSSLQFRF